jgi:hypothetical protein
MMMKRLLIAIALTALAGCADGAGIFQPSMEQRAALEQRCDAGSTSACIKLNAIENPAPTTVKCSTFATEFGGETTCQER